MRNTKTIGYLLAAFTVLVWGVTFVSTKALLTDFSALEILLYRFVAAYFALWIIRPKVEKISLKENLMLPSLVCQAWWCISLPKTPL